MARRSTTKPVDKRCKKYAYLIRTLVIALVAASITLQVLSSLSCEFVTTHLANGGSTDAGSIGLVYWRPLGTETCVTYKYFENYWLTTSRTGLYLAVVATGVLSLMMIVEVLLVRMCCSSTLHVATFLLSFVGSGVTFAVFGNPQCKGDYHCNLGQGSSLMVVALTSLLLASLVTSCTPKPDPLLQKCRQESRNNSSTNNDAADKDSPSIITDLSASEAFNPKKHTNVGVSTVVEDVD